MAIDPVDATLGRLRRAVARMRCVGDPDVAFVAAGITSVLSGDRDSLDAALGLRPGPGQRSLRTRHQIQERDDLYREAAQRFFPGLNPTRQAHKLHREFSRYETTGWRRGEWDRVTCPPRRDGTVQAVAWEILHLTGRVQSERSIRQILAAS